ncbi:hypothetical protein LJC30_01800 [Odoribacter sp. OttesenSCG-928-L07]|nr:hypothetical protein [Odoribacter sp. OttesenSCG-928-L07]MDL2238900.1 hypothetical protein [Bacteroidales bacterium OttesenSCG-928-L14]MDL2240640.1 hypothetical protein [Bacteroidales bacterium OttesenSCG-928-K22]
MQTSFNNIDEIFEFKGLWDIHSKCGLKIHKKDNKYIVLVSELYQDNPGTSVTQASCSLAKQICDAFQIPMNEIIYIEHNPGMNSKLSFYNEEFYMVEFEILENEFVNPKWTQLSKEQINFFLT